VRQGGNTEHRTQDHAIVHIRYSGPEKTVTIRSRWEERGGTPMIVDAGPVE
jgi:hypothetical protein